MKLFALDASGKTSSAAVLRDGEIAAESFLNVGLTHSGTLLAQVDDVLKAASLTAGDIDCFAVTSGPGSFTGLRIAISVVKGLAFLSDRPCVAVSTLEALAYTALPFGYLTVPVINARRERVYTALYREDGSGMPEIIVGEGVQPVNRLPEILGSFRDPAVFVGDAAEICSSCCKGRIECIPLSGERAYIRAGAVAEIALAKLKRGETVSASALAPVYLQLSQAEREKLEAEVTGRC